MRRAHRKLIDNYKFLVRAAHLASSTDDIMTNEAAFVFGVITIAAVLMASNRVRFDIVAPLLLLTYVVTLFVAPLVFPFNPS